MSRKEDCSKEREEYMSDLSLERVTENYYDVLKEIGNIGAGNAMTALAQMLQCKVDMKVPQVKLLEFSEVGEMMGGEEQVMVGVFLGVEGEITGSMMFMVEEISARHLIQKITMGMLPEGSEFSEMGLSAMQEVGNIITGAYLNSLSTLTNLKVFPTPPALTVDMAGAILSVPAIQFGIFGDKILLIQSQFYDEIELDGYFILIPDMESYEKILTALGLPIVS
jgi:chemotaxis protein CheC